MADKKDLEGINKALEQQAWDDFIKEYNKSPEVYAEDFRRAVDLGKIVNTTARRFGINPTVLANHEIGLRLLEKAGWDVEEWNRLKKLLPYYSTSGYKPSSKFSGPLLPEDLPTQKSISELPDYGYLDMPRDKPNIAESRYKIEGPGRKKELTEYYKNLVDVIEQAEVTEPFIDIAEEGLPRRGPATSKRGKGIVKQYGKGAHLDYRPGRKPKTAGMDYKRGHKPRKKEFLQAIANAIYDGDIKKVKKQDVKFFEQSWEQDLFGNLSTGDLRTILKNASAYDVKQLPAVMGVETTEMAEQILKQYAIEIELRKAQERGQAGRKATKEKFTTTGKEKALEDITSELRTEKTRVEAALRRSEADAKTAATPAARTAAEGSIVAARKRIKELNQNIKAAQKPKGIKGKGPKGKLGLIGLLGYLAYKASQDENASPDTQQAAIDVTALLSAMTNGEWDKWKAAYANPHTPASEKQTLKAYMTHVLQDLSEGMQDLLPPRNPFGGEITEVAAQDMVRRVDEAAQVMLTAKERAPLAGMERTEGHPFTPTKGLSKLEAALEKIAETTPTQPPTFLEEVGEKVGSYPYLWHHPEAERPTPKKPYTPPLISDPVPPGRHTFYTPEQIELMRQIENTQATIDERNIARTMDTMPGQMSKRFSDTADSRLYGGAESIWDDRELQWQREQRKVADPRAGWQPGPLEPPPDLRDPIARQLWSELPLEEQRNTWRVWVEEQRRRTPKVARPPGTERPPVIGGDHYRQPLRLVPDPEPLPESYADIINELFPEHVAGTYQPDPHLQGLIDQEAIAIGEADYAAEQARRARARNILGVPPPSASKSLPTIPKGITIDIPEIRGAYRGAPKMGPVGAGFVPIIAVSVLDIVRNPDIPWNEKPKHLADVGISVTTWGLKPLHDWAEEVEEKMSGVYKQQQLHPSEYPRYPGAEGPSVLGLPLSERTPQYGIGGGQIRTREVEVKDDPEHIDLPRWLRQLAAADYGPPDMSKMLKRLREGKAGYRDPYAQDVYEDDIARAAELVKQYSGEEPTTFGAHGRFAGANVPETFAPITFEQPSVFKELGLLEEE